VLYYECPEEIMKARALKRNDRASDNETIVTKRVTTFTKDTLPLIAEFAKTYTVDKINSENDINTVYKDTVSVLNRLGYKELSKWA